MKKIKNGLLWFLRSFLWLAPLLFIFDLVTKIICVKHNVDVTIIPGFFYFKLEHNPGMAWSILSDYPWLLATLSVIAFLALCVYVGLKYKKIRFITKISLYLMIAGCAGNMIDRVGQFVKGSIYEGGVIDFISFYFGKKIGFFPTFNIADMCLVIGVLILVVVMIVDEIILLRARNKTEDVKKEIATYLEKNPESEQKEQLTNLMKAMEKALVDRYQKKEWESLYQEIHEIIDNKEEIPHE